MTKCVRLPARGVVELGGVDRVGFLQGLVSNDVALAGPGRAVWAALLTPQGKWLADFFVIARGAALLLDAERDQVAPLIQRLGRYRLRADVSLRDASAEWFVHAAWDGRPDGPEAAVVVPDPRLPEAGWRVLSPTPLLESAMLAEWDARRIGLGLPDGSRDLEPEKTVLLEAGFDELGGVSWTKGCYMGQELTARTKYRGLVKRRLLPVALDGDVAPGTAITREGQEVGVVRSVAGRQALAVLRLDSLGPGLMAGGTRVTPVPPAWIRLPEPAA
jgi:folate-binding protein YgfZ